MTRLPIRLRLTLTFTAAVAVVFVCAGSFLYLRLQHTLDAGIRSSLQAQAAQVTALVRQADNGLRQGGSTTARSDSFAQVLTSSDAVYDSSPTLPPHPLLTPDELRRALRGQLVVDRSGANGDTGPDRLLAVPVSAQGQRLVVVVGASLADRNQALNALLYQLLLGGPAALAAVALAGHLLARAALRPVERMRQETQRMSGGVSTERVTLPPADDEIRRLGSTLNDLLERLELSVQRERRFAADASHELRTPLALLRTELELALRHPRSVDELVATLRSAAAEADRVAELAEGLLVLARADSAGLSLTRRSVPAAQLLDHVSQRYRGRAAVEHRQIVVEDAFEGCATVDAARVGQALDNLAENALRYGRGEITLRAQRGPAALELSVADRGGGFAPDFLPRAFDRFSRPDDARFGEGSGLGLSIVQAIARAHGGDVTAENLAGEGAAVTITIPLDPPA
jgi:signal transduction histidine kinase